MKKALFITLKILGVLLLLLIIIASIVYYRSANYKMFDIWGIGTDDQHIVSEQQISQQVEAWVDDMSFKEKVDQMYGEKPSNMAKVAVGFLLLKRFPHIYVGGNERLGIPPWTFSDGPRGARVMHHDVEHTTSFPVAMARGASWDIDLERRIHEVIAIEMRANDVNYAGTPCINLLRHPGWGRAQETYGEDPWHLGEFGLAAVQGLEHHQVMACPKHFALNSVENSRYIIDVQVDERALREVYLPHFKKVIQKGKPASIMTAYNLVRGEYCANNKYLLTDILRDEWGFEGFVTSDWFEGTHNGIGNVQAGLNVEMPFQKTYKYEVLEQGIKDGEISADDIDELVSQSLKTRLKYAIGSDQEKYTRDRIASSAHIELAREAAEKSMVLIKNDGVLPFASGPTKSILVIGEKADKEITGDHGSSEVTAPYVVSPLEGIRNYHEALGSEVNFISGEDPAAAAEAAEAADQVIVIVGFDANDEGEFLVINPKNVEVSADSGRLVGNKLSGGDREDLRLKAHDEELIKAISKANNNSVVVYMGGSALDMQSWEAGASAILFAWYAGMEGGNAIANVLYGDVNPSGKLPFTIARNQEDYPPFTPFARSIDYGYYHGYTLFEKERKEVAYPFGYGMTYTSFDISNLQIAHESYSTTDTLVVAVDVANTGDRAGAEVVQLYIGFEESGVDRPVKLLRDFEKVQLNPGEVKSCTLSVPIKDIAWYNPESASWEVERMQHKVFVGNSSASASLLHTYFDVK